MVSTSVPHTCQVERGATGNSGQRNVTAEARQTIPPAGQGLNFP